MASLHLPSAANAPQASQTGACTVFTAKPNSVRCAAMLLIAELKMIVFACIIMCRLIRAAKRTEARDCGAASACNPDSHSKASAIVH